MKRYNFYKISLVAITSLLAFSCTNLDEELYGRLSPSTYYKTQDEALSSVVGVYQKFRSVADIGDVFRAAEFGTDEFFVPGRTSGGWFDQNQIDIMTHKADQNNALLNRTWSWYIFPIIGAANAVLDGLQSSPSAENFKGMIAEVRAMRAYAYFYALDFWGNVPIFTKPKPDAENMPRTNTRKEVYDFVVSEFIAAANDLPSITTVARTAYYPRLTKEAVYSALAMVYLNAEVYTGTAHWADVITMCNNVINTNAYDLNVNVVDCFLSTNENSKEVITAFSVNPTLNAGNNQFILYTQHALDKLKYNLPFAPADGYSANTEVVNRYEAQDKRLKLIEYGPQYYLDGITPLKDSKGIQLELIPLKSITAADDNEGFKVLKYSPIGATWSGYNADNDLVLMRYADILLMKAEALFRTGDPNHEALPLINRIRTRSNASAISTLTLKDIENERARELVWEGYRRRDMIRFGSYFNEIWSFKTATTPIWRGIYPIPLPQITANPNLIQNPNYN